MKVADLKVALTARGLATDGLKKVLKERLLEALAPAPAPASPSDDLAGMGVKALKAAAVARGVDLTGCCEKSEIVAAIRAAPAAPAPAPSMFDSGSFSFKNEAPAPATAEAMLGSKREAKLIKQMIGRVVRSAATHHEVLDIAVTATKREVKVAFREISSLVHPDKCDHADAAQAFRRIKEAEEVLSDEASRATYDRKPSTPAPAPPPAPAPAPPPAPPPPQPADSRTYGSRFVWARGSELEPIPRRLSSGLSAERLSSLTTSEPAATPCYEEVPYVSFLRTATPPEPAPAPPPAYARAATPEPACAPPMHAPTPAPPAYAPPPTRAHAKEECAVCGRSTAADACSPWNVLTCDVHGCGNEVHTYCTLANPIETFACPACEAKPARHPSLDARIELQRAKDAEFKY